MRTVFINKLNHQLSNKEIDSQLSFYFYFTHPFHHLNHRKVHIFHTLKIYLNLKDRPLELVQRITHQIFLPVNYL